MVHLRFHPGQTVDISALCLQQKEEGTGKATKTDSQSMPLRRPTRLQQPSGTLAGQM